MEMIGLTVIVVIVITGMLIATVYKFNHPTTNIQKRYWNRELATNLLIAMTHTNVPECNNLSVRDLLQDCGSAFPRLNCYDKMSCEVVNNTIYDIINKTLINQMVSFDLTISSPFRTDFETGQPVFVTHINTFDCGQGIHNQEQAFEMVRLEGNQMMEINLTLCLD
ncbi:hypothetical protein JXB28_03200 [Candidatus Woesearchaeota archaeon]|nr:hypothetical protein [Candidatus Woesearchaeota archaeon]